LGGLVRVLVVASALLASGEAIPQTPSAKPPATLRDTGLYSNFATREVDRKHLAFQPQYPLWTDGALKRRWISLPPGTAIDGSDPDAWIFPVGTRFWKEFSFEGQPAETRYLERLADGQWLYAAYEWSADGREAHLAPERGRRGAVSLDGGRSHTIPGVSDCKVCHESNRTAVLGFSSLQLSPDIDPSALHSEPRPAPGVDLEYLIETDLLVGLPTSMHEAPPRIEAATATERAALGYLHANCGHCHNTEGPLRNLGLYLRHVENSADELALASAVDRPIKKPAPGQSKEAVLRVEPGHPERSGLAQRMGSRYAALQMPPLGTELVDEQAMELVRQWIAGLGGLHTESQRERRGK
jgi:hypothetical protein